MNFKFNGVRSLFYSSRSQLVYVGGEDGSLLAFQLQNPVFVKHVVMQAQAQEAVEVDYTNIKDYNTVMIEEQQFAMVLTLIEGEGAREAAAGALQPHPEHQGQAAADPGDQRGRRGARPPRPPRNRHRRRVARPDHQQGRNVLSLFTVRSRSCASPARSSASRTRSCSPRSSPSPGTR